MMRLPVLVLFCFCWVLLLAACADPARAAAAQTGGVHFSSLAPTAVNRAGRLLSVSLPLRNNGGAVAQAVTLTHVTAAGTLRTPTDLPRVVGDVSPGGVFRVTASLDAPVPAGGRFVLTARGTFVDTDGALTAFWVNRYVVVPAAYPPAPPDRQSGGRLLRAGRVSRLDRRSSVGRCFQHQRLRRNGRWRNAKRRGRDDGSGRRPRGRRVPFGRPFVFARWRDSARRKFRQQRSPERNVRRAARPAGVSALRVRSKRKPRRRRGQRVRL